MEVDAIKDFAAGRHILLIEDNEINAQISIAQLEPFGFTMEWAEDGARGVSMFLTSEPGYYSCIITDLMMPVMDGMEAARKIRDCGREDAGLPIVAITANAFSKDLDEYGESGINACMLKPYNKMDLVDWIIKNVSEHEGLDVSID